MQLVYDVDDALPGYAACMLIDADSQAMHANLFITIIPVWDHA